MSNVTSLGTISIGLSSPLVEAQIGKATQAQTMSLEHVSSKTIDDITMTFQATFKDKIFYTNSLKSTLTCCSLTGKMIWEYKDQSVRSSKGISVDKDSNVYIASSDNDSIIVLSSDGKHARKLLGSDDGISRPFGLVVDLKNGKLIVLDNNGVLLYGIQF
ncbi:unnamed protein product [Mytilus edulis]|uniref:Uncharacterized protein n=1 Tax=Mytilus edulis TaxID=6550 RepID=A0A8S3VQR7_MYTED|nr:unnamed protein product [Mytilus edulis]